MVQDIRTFPVAYLKVKACTAKMMLLYQVFRRGTTLDVPDFDATVSRFVNKSSIN